LPRSNGRLQGCRRYEPKEGQGRSRREHAIEGNAGAVAGKYAWIKQHATEFALGSMCRFLQVSRSAYYDWRHRVPTTAEKDDADLTGILQSEFNKSRATYGTCRLKAALLG
jgi:hypothetical protein